MKRVFFFGPLLLLDKMISIHILPERLGFPGLRKLDVLSLLLWIMMAGAGLMWGKLRQDMNPDFPQAYFSRNVLISQAFKLLH